MTNRRFGIPWPPLQGRWSRVRPWIGAAAAGVTACGAVAAGTLAARDGQLIVAALNALSAVAGLVILFAMGEVIGRQQMRDAGAPLVVLDFASGEGGPAIEVTPQQGGRLGRPTRLN